MTNYIKGLSDPWFSLIASGTKTVEGRLFRDDFKKIREGDTITFQNEEKFDEDGITFKRELTIRVSDLSIYPSFRDFLEIEGIENCLPGYQSVDLGEKVYYQYYTPADEKKFGVLSIKFQLI